MSGTLRMLSVQSYPTLNHAGPTSAIHDVKYIVRLHFGEPSGRYATKPVYDPNEAYELKRQLTQRQARLEAVWPDEHVLDLIIEEAENAAAEIINEAYDEGAGKAGADE